MAQVGVHPRRKSSGINNGGRTKTVPFIDPIQWAAARKQKMANAEKLRAKNRAQNKLSEVELNNDEDMTVEVANKMDMASRYEPASEDMRHRSPRRPMFFPVEQPASSDEPAGSETPSLGEPAPEPEYHEQRHEGESGLTKDHQRTSPYKNFFAPSAPASGDDMNIEEPAIFNRDYMDYTRRGQRNDRYHQRSDSNEPLTSAGSWDDAEPALTNIPPPARFMPVGPSNITSTTTDTKPYNHNNYQYPTTTMSLLEHNNGSSPSPLSHLYGQTAPSHTSDSNNLKNATINTTPMEHVPQRPGDLAYDNRRHNNDAVCKPATHKNNPPDSQKYVSQSWEHFHGALQTAAGDSISPPSSIHGKNTPPPSTHALRGEMKNEHESKMNHNELRIAAYERNWEEFHSRNGGDTRSGSNSITPRGKNNEGRTTQLTTTVHTTFGLSSLASKAAQKQQAAMNHDDKVPINRTNSHKSTNEASTTNDFGAGGAPLGGDGDCVPPHPGGLPINTAEFGVPSDSGIDDAPAQWMGSLRDAHVGNSFVADDPMVFGRPLPKPKGGKSDALNGNKENSKQPQVPQMTSLGVEQTGQEESLTPGTQWLGSLRDASIMDPRVTDDPLVFGKPMPRPKGSNKKLPPREKQHSSLLRRVPSKESAVANAGASLPTSNSTKDVPTLGRRGNAAIAPAKNCISYEFTPRSSRREIPAPKSNTTAHAIRDAAATHKTLRGKPGTPSSLLKQCSKKRIQPEGTDGSTSVPSQMDPSPFGPSTASSSCAASPRNYSLDDRRVRTKAGEHNESSDERTPRTYSSYPSTSSHPHSSHTSRGETHGYTTHMSRPVDKDNNTQLPAALRQRLDERHEHRAKSVRLPRLHQGDHYSPAELAAYERDQREGRHDQYVPPEVKEKTRAQSVTTRPKAKAGADDDDKCYRQMFDKNTLRTRSRSLFMKALAFRPQVVPIPYKPNESGVQIIVRKRPIFEKEMEKDYDVVATTERSVTLTNCQFQADLKEPFFTHYTFHLDRVFGETATNAEVYDNTRDLIDFAIQGGTGTMFMLGQTGSGKTHTMTSIEEYAAQDVFESGRFIHVEVNFLEVRANKVFDLLAEERDMELKIREDLNDGKIRTYVAENAATYACENPNELIQQIRYGHDKRATQSTEANDTSSRSHAICILNMITENGPSGKLLLVDCAGTERRKDSMHHSKERQTEGAHINSSLHALKECIRLRGDKGGVPAHAYRASALTKMLADAFSVKSGKMLVICTVSPGATDTEHSLTTLRTGFQLSNRPASNAQEVKQSGLKELVYGKPKVRHPMSKWSSDEVAEWLSKLGVGPGVVVPTSTTGHMLVRTPEATFVRNLGEVKGRQLYDIVRDEAVRDNKERMGRREV